MNQTSLTNEMQVFLEGIGFIENKNSPGLWNKEKDVEGDQPMRLFWDLRKDKPFFYGFQGNDKIPKKTLDVQEEYILFAKKFSIKGRDKKLDQQSSNTKLSVLDTKNQAFDLINERDNTQVMTELQGGFLKEFVYSFPTKEGNVVGLSWAGVKEVARQMGNISVEDCTISETPETYRVLCKAKDITRNVTMYGIAEQAKMMTLKSGDKVVDLHALSKAMSRAQRNSIRSLIPEIWIKNMIEEYMKNGK